MTQVTNKLTLTAGYYYYEIAAYNGGGSGHFQIMVETPELLEVPHANPTWQID